MHIIHRALAPAFMAALIGATAVPSQAPRAADDPVVIGFIGSFASDTGLSTLRGAEIAVEELNAAGGVLGGRPIKLVSADTREDVTEGIKAYEYLNEVEKVDFVVSGSLDDVSLGWLPRMAEYRTPTLDTIVYDTQTVDFGPIFNKAAAMKPDFMYLISSVNSQVPSSQYVKLQVPVPMTGINVAAFGLDFWNDTGGAGGGTSTLSPIPAAGMELDDVSRAFAEKYKAKYGGSRPIFPHFNGFNAYHGVKKAVAAAERAGGFEPLDAWVREMENTDVKLYKDGQLRHRYAYWKQGEIEPRTGREYTHNIKFDVTAPYDDGGPSTVVIQWYADGSAKVVYPPKYANGEFSVPPWIQ